MDNNDKHTGRIWNNKGKCQTYIERKYPRCTWDSAVRGLTFSDVAERDVSDGDRMGQGHDQVSSAACKAPALSRF